VRSAFGDVALPAITVQMFNGGCFPAHAPSLDVPVEFLNLRYRWKLIVLGPGLDAACFIDDAESCLVM
jgi:hypothetical protein